MKHLEQQYPHLFYPVLLGIAGAGAVLAAGGPGWTGGALAAALGLGGIGAAARAATHHNRFRQAVERHVASQQGFGEKIAPVWAGHIETSRTQMETAITALSEDFARIVEQLDAALRSAGMASGTADGHGESLVAVFDRSERQLAAVVASQRTAMDSMAAMLEKVQGLNQFITELQGMANDVAKIAAQSNLLALNAAIEAARAGEMGRGFAVVAKEFRMLSNQSGETGRHIANKVDLISGAIIETCRAAEATVQQEDGAMAESESTINAVLEGFRKVTGGLQESSALLKQESVAIKDGIGQALVQLQFQDRVNQILTQVKGSIEQLPRYLAQGSTQLHRHGAPQPLDASVLLQDMKDSYVMSDQRAVHSGERVAAKNDSDITFF